MNEWHKKYDELKQFLANAASIHIDRHVMIIPDDVRPAFYRHFDGIRRQYIEDNFPGLLADAAELSANYVEARDAVASQLKLEAVETSPHLRWFLNDPADGLMHGLADPLFELIKSTITLEEFDERARSSVEKAAGNNLHNGYRHWVMLSIARLMQPERAYVVPLPDQLVEPELNDAETIPGLNVHEMPEAVEAKSVKLDLSQYMPFIAPNIIVYSGLLEAYAGIRDGYNNVFRRAKALSKRVEWLKLGDVRCKYGASDLWPDLGIYLNSTKERLKILADYFLAYRPDVTIEIVASAEWHTEDMQEKAGRHKDILPPRGGTFIISRKPPVQREAGTAEISEAIGQPENERIPVLVAGYDASKLMPIIDALKSLELPPPAEEHEDLEEVPYHKLL